MSENPIPLGNDGANTNNFLAGLRFLFVQLLFCLAIGEVGVQATNLFLRSDALPTDFVTSSLAHLILAAVVISTSWVGWSSSLSNSTNDKVGVFTKSFLVMLIDVALVVVYFMLARSAQVPAPGTGDPLPPSAAWQCSLMLCTFILYLIWDIVTKWSRTDSARLKERGRWTLLCFFLSVTIWFVVKDVEGLWPILLVDGALLCTDLSFRAFKDTTERIRLGYVLVGLTVLFIFLASVINVVVKAP